MNRLIAVFFGDTAKVVTHCSQGQAVREIVRVKANKVEAVLPKSPALAVAKP